jgi:hypothetical protein
MVFVLKTGITWNPATQHGDRLLRGDLLSAAAQLD